MNDSNELQYITRILENIPVGWLQLTTHRLDIYEEHLAKTQFLEQFEQLFDTNNTDQAALAELPTAYDYIRLGHPLSSVLEWTVARLMNLRPESVISFASKTLPLMAVLRKNLLEEKSTQILYKDSLPAYFDAESLRSIYGYSFDLQQIESTKDIPPFAGSTVVLLDRLPLENAQIPEGIDFLLALYDELGSVLLVNSDAHSSYISEIQHVRRRETIAMTPANCFSILQKLTGISLQTDSENPRNATLNKETVTKTIQRITGTETPVLIASSGLSIQYAIVMGLIDHALEAHKGKAIKIIVPPNCYGGTNDQARRIAACIDRVEVLDLLVDDGHDMVESLDAILENVAKDDAVPYIIAEIPTNPRVEVPDLDALAKALGKLRTTSDGRNAVEPVFILDQTFCPNFHFLREEDVLSSVKTIAYISGSKFPSGGRCTAGYCVANGQARSLMGNIEKHLILCDNEATHLQLQLLAEYLPSMNERIQAAYDNTREFVRFIADVLPDAKINFVSEELAARGFTPSVFSLDLPTKGDSEREREAYKRDLNLKLINLMIHRIPEECKYCVSYGQLKGSYWTIPATSTQGTTKEDDKDYIVRTSLSSNMDLEHHKEVFREFVTQIQ